jgi:hypothetical protein
MISLVLSQAAFYTVIAHTQGSAPQLEQIAQPYTLDAQYEGLLWIHGCHDEHSETGAALLSSYLLARSGGFLP